MSIKFLFLLIVLGLSSCVSPKYITIKESELIDLDLENSIVNYIPLSDKALQASPILDSTYSLIQKKRFSKLDSYIKKLEKSGVNTSDYYLSKTLFFIAVKDYFGANAYVEKINDSDYLLLKRLLSIDIFYEIEKVNGSFSYTAYLKKYQDLTDAFPQNESLKKLVAIRLRYLRYLN